MNLDQETKLIELRANHESERSIAGAIGVSPSTVHRSLSRKEIRDKVQAFQERVISELSETSFQNVKHAIDYYKKPIDLLRYTDNNGRMRLLKVSDDLLREHGAKFSLEVMRAVGALPSHSTSIIIQQFNDNRSMEVPQVIRDILQEVTHRDLNQRNLLADFDLDVKSGVEPLNEAVSPLNEDIGSAIPHRPDEGKD